MSKIIGVMVLVLVITSATLFVLQQNTQKQAPQPQFDQNQRQFQAEAPPVLANGFIIAEGFPKSFSIKFTTSLGESVDVVAPYKGMYKLDNRQDDVMLWETKADYTTTLGLKSGIVELHCYADKLNEPVDFTHKYKSPLWVLILGQKNKQVNCGLMFGSHRFDFNFGIGQVDNGPIKYYGITIKPN